MTSNAKILLVLAAIPVAAYFAYNALKSSKKKTPGYRATFLTFSLL
jgi:hypothetical protein